VNITLNYDHSRGDKCMPTLRELRESRKMSRVELAAKAHVSIFTISRLETGQNIPRHNTLDAIASVLSVKPSEIQFPEVRPEMKILPKRKSGG
jgi:transcriptional regulator with XRE-family HTH domain